MAGEDVREILIRPWNPALDPVSDVTALLHAAYAEWKEVGLRFTATWQDDEITLDRLSTAACAWVAYQNPCPNSGWGRGRGRGAEAQQRRDGLSNEELTMGEEAGGEGRVGLKLSSEGLDDFPDGADEIESKLVGTIALYAHDPEDSVPYYRRPGLFYFGQFGVHPSTKGSGLGRRLLEVATEYAIQHGCTELACDTSAQAIRLIELYRHWGFTEVDRFSWHSTNYESLILARPLP